MYSYNNMYTYIVGLFILLTCLSFFPGSYKLRDIDYAREGSKSLASMQNWQDCMANYGILIVCLVMNTEIETWPYSSFKISWCV